MKNRVQTIDRDGKPEYAVIPWADYLRLTAGEDEMSDEVLYARAKYTDEDLAAIPSEIAERIFAGESPIRVLREWRRLKVKELANRAGISPSYLSEIEHGKRAGVPTLIAIARELAVGIDLIVTDGGERAG
ncbi:MAG: helix-turn-helix domain-containing protein [Alphaproteobacteria bacterium]|jgi:DNA-binding Xre family transcriptional regulator|nr:helix-turn-helix transcriptional regulator [Pseudomonadota bacterium]MCH7635791.1 helix-turn-helix transcriptional regulator [Pseudomonadota bacterium]MCZ6483237.1 helix-turn-helix transcriptional regulator [Alphaproteobacteria bacterium]